MFFRNEKEIDPEFISIVNDTTISMYVEKPPPAEDMYYCKLKLNDGFPKPHEAVCLNKVVIGCKYFLVLRTKLLNAYQREVREVYKNYE